MPRQRRLDAPDTFHHVMGHDETIRSLVPTIRQNMAPPERSRRSIGFRVEEAGLACHRGWLPGASSRGRGR